MHGRMGGQIFVSVLLLGTLLCVEGSHIVSDSITVNLNTADQNHRTIHVPSVCRLYLNATGCGPSCNWNWTSNGSPVVGCSQSPCIGVSCCLNDLNGSTSLNISNSLSVSSPFTLTIVVANGIFGCSVYLFPLELAPPLTFECTPAVACRALNTSVANISDVHLDWTYTSSSSATGTTVVNSTDRGVAVTHDGIEIARGATIQVAGSYTPLLNGTAFVAGQQIYSLKFLNIDDPSLIHSTAVVKGDGVKLSCSVEAEPNATVSWSFQPKEAGCLPKLNASTFWYSTSKQFVFEYATSYAEYCDAGIYTCVVSNGFKEISTQLRLRVRDPLRPVWPAIGIVMCFAITALFIVIGTKCDDVIAKRKAKDTNNATFRRSSSTADYNVVTTPTGDAVRYRLGSKLTFEPSSLGTPC